MRQHIIPPGVAETPLKTYLLRAFPAMPAWLVKETLKKRDVRVNGVKCGADALIRPGDTLALYVPERYLTGNLEIIYQDDDLLVVDKPSGIPVDLDERGIGADTMLSRIQGACPGAQLCHRLDTYTGGVLIAAKTGEVHERMLKAFRERTLTKLYHCIATGMPGKTEETLTGYLIKDANAARVRVVDHPAPHALPVKTRYRLLTAKDSLSLLEIELFTGRTHQIRAHLSHIGLPILGDDKYGDRAANKRMKAAQPALWCTHIEWEGHIFSSEPNFSPYGF